MTLHYLLWCSGEDHRGIVASLTGILLKEGCNLEDSSMMKLGSEFAVFLILTTKKQLHRGMFAPLEHKLNLTIGIKKITSAQARFHPPRRNLSIVSVHGPDRPGIVHRVTECLARKGFNITDLSTHRTKTGKRPGFILFIEGESKGAPGPLKTALMKLERSLGTRITIHPVIAQPI